jgi:hypothetical protein
MVLRRRLRKEMAIMAREYVEGHPDATAEEVEEHVRASIVREFAADEDRPFRDLLLKLFEELWPVIVELLKKWLKP